MDQMTMFKRVLAYFISPTSHIRWFILHKATLNFSVIVRKVTALGYESYDICGVLFPIKGTRRL